MMKPISAFDAIFRALTSQQTDWLLGRAITKSL